MSRHIAQPRPPEEASRTRRLLTPGRVVALVAGVLLVVSIRRLLSRVRGMLKYKRRLQLALSVLVLLRQLRNELSSR